MAEPPTTRRARAGVVTVTETYAYPEIPPRMRPHGAATRLRDAADTPALPGRP